MMKDATRAPRRVLEPADRVSEVLFGLIMVLTFTGSLSVAEAGRADVRTMLVGALGCNIAWGIIDGILYLMGCLTEKGSGIRALKAIQKATTPEQAHLVISDALPPLVATMLGPGDYESIRQKLVRLPEPPPAPRLSRAEWAGAAAVFFWVFITTFPVAVPFIVIGDVGTAMRVSNTVAVLLLFLTGHAFGRIAGYRPWTSGLFMVVLGSVLVAVTMALVG
jgi:VIT1/CCC1 family predicted Fe2+/Mn2+ transporter